jgi:hypothetical protein
LVANAFYHRDYTIPGAAVSAAMYDDYVEIINAGVSTLRHHTGDAANRTNLGPGTRSSPMYSTVPGSSSSAKVIDWCRDNANSAPIWEEQSGSVVTFRPAPGKSPRK